MGKLKKLSWDGKNADNPKPFAKVSANNEPVTREELAEVEANILKVLEEMLKKISATGPADNTKSTKQAKGKSRK
jgi:hypothetical protein